MTYLDKRVPGIGLTPLPDPGGNYAEHVWDSLSGSMQDALWGLVSGDRNSYKTLVEGYQRTLQGLERRGLVTATADPTIRVLTERGEALVEWMLWAASEGEIDDPDQTWKGASFAGCGEISEADLPWTVTWVR